MKMKIKSIYIIFLFITSCADLSVKKDIDKKANESQPSRPNLEIRFVGHKELTTRILWKLSREMPKPRSYWRPGAFLYVPTPVKVVDSPTYREDEVQVLLEGRLKIGNKYLFHVANGDYYGYFKMPDSMFYDFYYMNKVPFIYERNLDFEILFGYKYPDFEKFTVFGSEVILENDTSSCEGFIKYKKGEKFNDFFFPNRDNIYHCPILRIQENKKTIVEIKILNSEYYPSYVWKRWIPGILLLLPFYGSVPEKLEFELNIFYEDLNERSITE
jgi:hypothetical protein